MVGKCWRNIQNTTTCRYFQNSPTPERIAKKFILAHFLIGQKKLSTKKRKSPPHFFHQNPDSGETTRRSCKELRSDVVSASNVSDPQFAEQTLLSSLQSFQISLSRAERSLVISNRLHTKCCAGPKNCTGPGFRKMRSDGGGRRCANFLPSNSRVPDSMNRRSLSASNG